MISVLQVTKILDKRTLVIQDEKPGTLLGYVSTGATLVIIAVNPSVRLPDNSVLVVPKAHLEVTANMGTYLIAQPVSQTIEEDNMKGFFHKVQRRVIPALPIAEGQASGNPGGAEIRVGDIVIEQMSLADYVAQISTETGI